MSEEIEWGETVFQFGQDYLKENRGIDGSSVAVSRLEKLAVYVGDRSHGPMHSFIDSVWRPSISRWVKPACELHVTNTATQHRESYAIEGGVTEYGEVLLTYLGTTASSKPLEIRMNLTKLEALQLAQSLILAAVEIEKSENRE